MYFTYIFELAGAEFGTFARTFVQEPSSASLEVGCGARQ